MDVESGRTLTVDLDLEEREGYRKAHDRFHITLADYCRKQRICYSRHRDSKEWKATLTDHLLQQNSL
jgi:DNA-binding GntR family transcriptional regulator